MATSSISTLDTYYQNLINYTLTQEKQPITRLTKQKDDINVKKAVYTDLNTKFNTLQTAINALRSSQGTYALTAGRSVNVSPATSGTTVATATVNSSVSAGTYALSVTTLAKAHQVHSARQTTIADTALGKEGTFVIGGAAVRSATLTGNAVPATVSSIISDGSSTILTGQKELGSGSYSIETTGNSTDGWKFRIVNADGVAQSIQTGSTGAFTTNWQSTPAGETYDTGRGLSVVFGPNTPESPFTAGAAQLDYVARGASITVTGTMTLVDINSAINAATYASGNEVSSSVIDNTLVLKNQSTGVAHTMKAADVSGTVLKDLGVIKNDLSLNTIVAPVNASFSVNGMTTTTRSSNTGLTDVITGMTLNLSSDAEGKNANIVISSDMNAAQTAIKTFISAFNDLTSYIRNKTTTIKNADNTYTRGSLVSEQNFRYAAYDLLAVMNQDSTNTGIYQNLAQIGISVNPDLSASISDSAKLATALNTQLADVTKLIDGVMNSMSTRVGTYTGTTGYINQSLTNADSQVTTLTSRITSLNDRIARRQDALVKQYSEIQAQMETIKNQYTLNTTLYG
jgi:flagellar hook-associated protein 2